MSTPESLSEVRTRIDALDADLVRLLARRQDLVRAAAAFKADAQAVRVPDRVEQVIAGARPDHPRRAGAGSIRGGEQITDTGYRWKADAAHKILFSNIQGASRFNGRWYLGQSNGDSNGTLYQTDKTSAGTETLKVATSQPASIGPEDLSY